MGVRLAVLPSILIWCSKGDFFPGPGNLQFIPGLTDDTIDEYIARVFPLYGVTRKGY